ncbi:MAG: hypothetical protein NTZ61_06690, partial [Proteobacteria bacterium]|nr:hypothetical protein [Pseudomonadota bacterium]
MQQQRVALGNRFEDEVVDAHDARLGAVEHRARDQPVDAAAYARGDGAGVVVAAARLRLDHLDAVLARDARRIHHVDAIRHRLEQALQHRDGDRRDAQIGDAAGVLDLDLLDLAGAELALEAAELLAEQQVRPQLRQQFGRHRRHVHAVAHFAVEQEVAHLLGHLDRYVQLRLFGRSAEVRRADHLWMQHQRVILRRRFLLEDVEPRAAHLPALERGVERLLVDDPAARGVDDQQTAPALRECGGAEQPGRVLGLRHVHRECVGAREQRVEIDQIDVELGGD